MVTTSPIDSENEVDGECAVSVSRCAAMQNPPRPREVALAFVEKPIRSQTDRSIGVPATRHRTDDTARGDRAATTRLRAVASGATGRCGTLSADRL
ncbi:hypothetical protein CH249_07645 [Rhodococcus sp. 05-2255-3B1]|nr:hypothetical protein CH250_11700 [Rhodococcus sp. 05-2255-3C]OZE14276.1 hypothetical protein CH249_07645 [Rhodococcus sp. 05-2255-3B1]OZE24848.1 hypothetical protein CH255_01520 [Rhodococcus sp. 05-2255-2A2]